MKERNKEEEEIEVKDEKTEDSEKIEGEDEKENKTKERNKWCIKTRTTRTCIKKKQRQGKKEVDDEKNKRKWKE